MAGRPLPCGGQHAEHILIIGDFLSKYWKNSWVLVASRLTKSGVLSTSFWRGRHFFRCQGSNLDFPLPQWSLWRAQRAIFQEKWASARGI